MTLKDIIEREKNCTKEITKDMSKKQKLAYFWDYYKWHFLITVAVIIFVIYLIVHYVNAKEEALFAAMVNFSATETEEAEFKNAFIQYINLDTDKYSVDINDTVTIGLGASLGTPYTGHDLLAAYIGGDQLDVMCTGENVFFDYAYEDTFLPLSRYMSEEEIEKLDGRLYYVDASVVEGYTEAIRNMDYDYSADAAEPDKPGEMERPVAVGVFVDDSYWIDKCFKCDDEEVGRFVAGVVANSHRTENAAKFIFFLTDKTKE